MALSAGSGTTFRSMRANMRVFQYLFDALAWMVAIVVAVWLRFEFAFDDTNWFAMLMICLAAAAAQLVAGLILSLYRRRYHVGSFDEVLSLTGSVLLTAAVVGIPILIFGAEIGVPRSTP